jgi:hypothetical protein
MRKAAPKTVPTWKLAAAGAMGSLAPEIVLLYSKRWTMSGVRFEMTQYVLVSLLYAALAGFVAMIYPYRGSAARWKAFQTGMALPILVGVAASLVRDRVTERGLDQIGSLTDLLSLF